MNCERCNGSGELGVAMRGLYIEGTSQAKDWFEGYNIGMPF